MSLLLVLSLACNSVPCGVESIETATEYRAATGIGTAEQTDASMPAQLIAFDGGEQFLRTSKRLRIWRQAVEFALTIDPQGRPSGCEVVNRFRSNYVNLALCKVLLKHHTFEPARDAQNQPVEGMYHARLSYSTLRAELD